MEDVEDDSQVNDDEWEDMELEDDMENIHIIFLYKKLQNSHSEVEAQLFQR